MRRLRVCLARRRVVVWFRLTVWADVARVETEHRLVDAYDRLVEAEAA